MKPLSDLLSEQFGLFKLGEMPRVCREYFIRFGAVDSARRLVRATVRPVTLAPEDERRPFDCCEPRWHIRQIALQCRRQTETRASTQGAIRRFDEVGEHVAIPEGGIEP
jgi:hypothetical protein